MFRAASEGCQWFHPMERTLPISNPELAQPFIEQHSTAVAMGVRLITIVSANASNPPS
jgi:hypothetical protein